MEIALYQPEIPPNTGAIARLCVLTGSPLHIIGKPAFSIDDKAARRAGLDYWSDLNLTLHEDWPAFMRAADKKLSAPGADGDVVIFSKRGRTSYADRRFRRDDILVFGSETSGLPGFIHDDIEARGPDRVLVIPMKVENRSHNLASAAGIALYEGLRQTGFKFWVR